MKSFIEVGLNENIVKGLEKQNVNTPTKIQELTIPYILDNKDIIGQSYTGSGKTLAFVCPLFNQIETSTKELQGLIIAPTHELVIQIENQIKLLASNSKILVKSLAIIGDVNIDKQIKKIRDTKPHVIVGTPGRVFDLIKKKKIKAHTLKTIVLDEGDNLLNNTNLKTVKDIIKSAMRDTRILLFSATIDNKLLAIASDIMKEPEFLKGDEKSSLNPNIEHLYLNVDERDKVSIIRKLIFAVNPNKALVFINKSYEIELIEEKLNYHNLNVLSIHGKSSKEQRQSAIEKFRSGKLKILISSDISARGLDIDDIDYIINLDFPTSASEYLHRAGRTARAGKRGIVISLVTDKEKAAIRVYEREFKIKFEGRTLQNGKVI